MSRRRHRDFNRLIDGIPHRECLTCYEWKPLTEFQVLRRKLLRLGNFNREAKHQPILAVYCKACEAKRKKKSRETE